MCSRPTGIQSGCPPVSVCLSVAKCQVKLLVEVGLRFSDWSGTGFEFYRACCFASPGRHGWGNLGGGCLLPRPQGIVELTLFLDCLAHPVSLPGDRATSIHLEGLPRGRVNRWLSPLEQWVFRGGKVTCAPNLDSKSLPNKGTGHSGMCKNS